MNLAATAAIDRPSARWVACSAAAAVLPLGLLLTPGTQALLALCFAVGVASAWSGRRVPRLLRLLLTGAAVIGVLVLFEVGFGARLFGRDAGSALLAAMLGIKLLEMEQIRDGRSAVSFSVFALMAAFLQDQGPQTLLLALLGGLLALATLGRLAEAESPASPDPLGAPATLRSRLQSALRLAALSLPLALVGFFLFPRFASPLWGLPENSNEGRVGLSEDMSPGDISKLFIDDSPLLRVSFDGPIPAPADRYFRGPVLARFDGRQWTKAFISNDRPAELAQASAPIGYEVEQEPTERRYLFALDLARSAPSGARLTYERGVYTERPQIRLTRHRFESSTGFVFEPELRRTLRDFYLQLPDGFNPRALERAQAWRQQLATPDAIIGAALDWFNAEFTYTLEPPLLGRDSVDDFLFETRRGYCEHFSSAFVVLMRAAGIPARVVTGYQGGDVNPLGNYLVVRQSDAHAWAEVWLQGRGWVRVDPTSAVSPARIESGSDSLRPDSALGDLLQPLRSTADWLRRGWNDFVLGYNASRQRQLLRPFGIDDASWQQLGALLASAAGLALLVTLALLLRPARDPRPPVVRAWHRLLKRMQKAGLGKATAETPLAYGARISAALGDRVGDLQALCVRYSDWQYANAGPDRASSEALVRDLQRYRPR